MHVSYCMSGQASVKKYFKWEVIWVWLINLKNTIKQQLVFGQSFKIISKCICSAFQNSSREVIFFFFSKIGSTFTQYHFFHLEG